MMNTSTTGILTGIDKKVKKIENVRTIDPDHFFVLLGHGIFQFVAFPVPVKDARLSCIFMARLIF